MVVSLQTHYGPFNPDLARKQHIWIEIIFATSEIEAEHANPKTSAAPYVLSPMGHCILLFLRVYFNLKFLLLRYKAIHS